MTPWGGRTCWRGALASLVGAAALLAWWRFLGGPDVIRALVEARPGLVLLGFLSLASSQAFRLLRWHLLLSGLGPVPLGRSFRILYAAELLNAFLPIKLGDAGRALALSRRPPFTFGGSTATIVADRFYGIFVRLLVAPFALLFALPATSSRPLFLSAAAFGGILATSVVAGLTLYRHPGALEALSRVGLRIVPGRFRDPAARTVSEFVSTFGSLNLRPTMSMGALLLSFVALGLQASSLWLLFASTGEVIGPLTALVGTAYLDILAVLPAPPAGLGVAEWSVSFVFAWTLGVPGVVTSATALLYHGLWLLLVTVLGAASVSAVGEMLPREPGSVGRIL